MIQVELADPAITVHNWPREMDKLGQYTLKIRKTPEEMKAERDKLKETFGGKAKKVNPIRFECNTVIDHDTEDPTTVYFLPGLWPRIKGYMEASGIPYEITADYRDQSIRPQIDYEAIKDVEFRKAQDVALALVATSDCGIIEALTGFGKSYLFGVICRAFPTLNILICTDSTSVVQQIYSYLMDQIPHEVGILTGTKDTSHNKRVVVSTLRSISKIPPDAPNLVIVDECHCISPGQSSAAIMEFKFARKFGFSASPIRNDGSQLLLESILGPTILKLDYDEGVEEGMVVPMKYAMLHCTWCPTLCHKEDLSEVIMKRFSYWRNKARNETIAAFVKSLLAVAPDIQILLICATMEHCIALNMLLPNFTVLYYGKTDMEDLARKFPKEKFPHLDLTRYKMTQKQLEIGRAAFAKGTLKRVISTMILKQGVSANHLRVLVRCDGATSKILGIQIPGRLSRLDEGKEYGYLIDVDDDFCAWARRRAINRDSQYQAQQWTRIQPQDVINDFRAITDSDSQATT